MKKTLSGKKWTFRGQKKSDESFSDAFFRVRNFKKSFLKKAKIADLKADFPDLKKVVDRIFRAISQKEKILLFGDFDLDGASGVATLFLAMKKIGADIFPKLPSRDDGYGLSKKVFDDAAKNGVSLVISVDCGASNFDEITFGNEKNIDTIITDHHTIGQKIPPAVGILHPHFCPENSENADLTGAGVAFFLAKALLKNHFPDKNLDEFLAALLEIAVLGTIADVGILRGNNRVIAKIGLEKMRKTRHPGLLNLFKIAKIAPENLDAEAIAFLIAPRLNAAGRLAHPHLALRLLLGDGSVAAELENLNSARREVTNDLTARAEKMIGKKIPPAIVLFSPDFFAGVSGLLAARIAEKFDRPTVICAPKKTKIVASCRGPADFHFADALRKMSELFEKFGGHAAAAGFSMRGENFEKFKKKFCDLTEKSRGKNPPPPPILADFSADFADFFEKSFENIFAAAPFGAGNPPPIFEIKNVFLKNARLVGGDKSHLFGKLAAGNFSAPAIFFRGGKYFAGKDFEKKFDALVAPEMSIFRGKKGLKFKILDLKKNF